MYKEVFIIEKIANPSNTKRILNQYKFVLQKKYGQNFLTDLYVLDQIIEASEISSNDYVIEIGPGIGSLTQALAEKAGQVVAIEIDAHLIPILKETLKGYDNIKILNEDVLKFGQTIVRVDPAYFRPTEVELLIGDASKARQKLGWKPNYELNDLIAEMVNADLRLMRKDEYLKKGGFSIYNYFE